MESNVFSLPESFDTGDGGLGRHGSRAARNKLPQWLVLYTVLVKEREHAEITHLCRATDVFENWSNATPAELHEIQLWSGYGQRQRKRDRDRQAQKEFFCFVLDRCFLLRSPVRLKREQFQGRQLQRVSRPTYEVYKLLSEEPGQHLMACPSGGDLLPELKREKGWLVQVPRGLAVLSQTQAVATPLNLWMPGSMMAGLHVQARWNKSIVRLSSMQEIQIVRLNFAMQNAKDIPVVVSCVARFLEPKLGPFDPEALQQMLESVPGKYKLHTQMLRLDWLHMHHRRCLMAEQALCSHTSVSRFLSMDASPQGGYEYLAMTEEVLVRKLPFMPPADPFKGFSHEFRLMPVMTLARGEARTFVKAQRLKSAIILEAGEPHFQLYRKQVKGWVSDQGTERLIPEWPIGDEAAMKSLAASLKEEATLENLAAGTSEAFLFNSLKHPGILHVLFNSLEECCKGCPRWDAVEKQVSAVSKLLTNRSYKEIVVSVMLKHASGEHRRIVQRYHGELLSWRWESLHADSVGALGSFSLSDAALCDMVDAALKDPFHLAYVHWAFMFACFVQGWAHWFEGCFCHEKELLENKSSRTRTTIKCPWKGKRSCVLCAGYRDEITNSVYRLASASLTEVLLELPDEVGAAMALMDQKARDKWASIVKGKLDYLGHVPHLLAAGFAHHARPDLYSLQQSKDAVRECFTQYESLRGQGRTTELLESLFHRKGDAGLAEQLWSFCESPADKVLEDFPLAFAEIQDRSFCPMAERSTERQHVLIKIACRRTLRHAGPAMTCARARRSQLQSMIDTPKECSFLEANWGSKGLDLELLSHIMPKAECMTKTRSYRVARIYGYHEEDHFLDHQADEEAAAKALQDRTQLALQDAAEDDASGVKTLEKKQWMIVDYLKSQLQSGILFSLPEGLFRAMLAGPPSEDSEAVHPEICLDLESFAEALLPEDNPDVSAEDLIYGYVVDARPERRTQNKALAQESHKGFVHVLRFTAVDLQQPAVPHVLYSNTMQHTLDFAKVATPAMLKLLSSELRVWTAKATSVKVQIMPQAGSSDALVHDGPSAALRLPAFVTDDDMLDDLAREDGVVSLQHAAAGPQAEAGILPDNQQSLLQGLLERRALGENFVDVIQLPHYNADACRSLVDKGLVQARVDDFGAVTVALSEATKVTSRLALRDPTPLCQEETVMNNGPGRNKLAWLKMLLQDGWKAAATGDWHNRGQALNLPSGLLDRPEMHLKALCFHVSLWEKGLLKISHSGSVAYYEMLLKETTLSAVNDFSLKQCKEFAFERKRKRPAHGQSAARPEQGILRLSLDLPSLPAVPCRVPGMADLTVHFDNWSHSSGHRRGFIQCTRHAKCRRYSFLKSHCDQATCVAWLLVWCQEGHRFEDTRQHVAFNPDPASVSRMKERQRLGA
ncbi:TOP2 [Symbiodinium sp. CCMP2592]|nr:TOP2 [Symbiodinium sp. CCMP2592]